MTGGLDGVSKVKSRAESVSPAMFEHGRVMWLSAEVTGIELKSAAERDQVERPADHHRNT